MFTWAFLKSVLLRQDCDHFSYVEHGTIYVHHGIAGFTALGRAQRSGSSWLPSGQLGLEQMQVGLQRPVQADPEFLIINA